MTDDPHRAISLAVGGFIAMAAAMGIGRFVYTPILPFMAEGIGLTKPQAGLIASANFLGYLLGALAAASPMSSRRQARLVRRGAGGKRALDGSHGACFRHRAAFLLLRLAGGIASAFVLVFSSALVLERLAAMGRPGLSSLHFAGVGAGIALSALMIAALEAAGSAGGRNGWQAAGSPCWPCWRRCSSCRPTRRRRRRHPRRRARQVRPRMIRLVLAYGLFGFGYVITATFISTIARSTPALHAIEPLVWLAVAAGRGTLGGALGRDRPAARQRGQLCAGQPHPGSGRRAQRARCGHSPAMLAAAILLGGTIMGLTALGLIQARKLARGDRAAKPRPDDRRLRLRPDDRPQLRGLSPMHFTGSFRAPSLAAAVALVIAAALVGLPLRRYRF